MCFAAEVGEKEKVEGRGVSALDGGVWKEGGRTKATPPPALPLVECTFICHTPPPHRP